MVVLSDSYPDGWPSGWWPDGHPRSVPSPMFAPRSQSDRSRRGCPRTGRPACH